MKKILLFVFLSLCFVSTVFAEDTESTNTELIICDTGYYYNGEASDLQTNLNGGNNYSKKDCNYSIAPSAKCTCIKCPGSGTTEQESKCTKGSGETATYTCDVRTIDDCTIAIARTDRTGSFYYKPTGGCKFNTDASEEDLILVSDGNGGKTLLQYTGTQKKTGGTITVEQSKLGGKNFSFTQQTDVIKH